MRPPKKIALGGRDSAWKRALSRHNEKSDDGSDDDAIAHIFCVGPKLCAASVDIRGLGNALHELIHETSMRVQVLHVSRWPSVSS